MDFRMGNRHSMVQPFCSRKISFKPGCYKLGTFPYGNHMDVWGYTVNNFLIKRWHPLPLIVIANALIIICLLGMAIASSLLPFAWPNILNLISINAPKGVQGKVMGISQYFSLCELYYCNIPR